MSNPQYPGGFQQYPPQHQQPKKRGIGRTILIGVAALFGLMIVVGVLGSFFGGTKPASTAGGAAAPTAAAEEAPAGDDTVVYEVTGTGKAASVFYTTKGGASEQATDAKLPYRKEIVWPDGVGAFDYLTVNASNGANGGKITCRILVNDEVVGESSSTGQYASVSCNNQQKP